MFFNPCCTLQRQTEKSLRHDVMKNLFYWIWYFLAALTLPVQWEAPPPALVVLTWTVVGGWCTRALLYCSFWIKGNEFCLQQRVIDFISLRSDLQVFFFWTAWFVPLNSTTNKYESQMCGRPCRSAGKCFCSCLFSITGQSVPSFCEVGVWQRGGDAETQWWRQRRIAERKTLTWLAFGETPKMDWFPPVKSCIGQDGVFLQCSNKLRLYTGEHLLRFSPDYKCVC